MLQLQVTALFKCLFYYRLVLENDYVVIPSMIRFNSNEVKRSVNIVTMFDVLLELNERMYLSFEIYSSYKEMGVTEMFSLNTTVIIFSNESKFILS